VAALALRKFLHSDTIKGNLGYGCWKVSSVAYVLNGESTTEDDTTGTRKRHVVRPYHEAVPFLRNGFFQDAALVRKGFTPYASFVRQDRDNASILVGAVGHLDGDLKTEADVMPMVERLLPPGSSSGSRPKGKDGEILARVETIVHRSYEAAMDRAQMTVARAMVGNGSYEPPTDGTSEPELCQLRHDLQGLVRQGGSVAKSTALHVSAAKNITKVAKLLLQMDRSSAQTRDGWGLTPLMVAAMNATGRLSINGINETEIIDALLLAEGGAANSSKAQRDSVGMTAYGYFRQRSEAHLQMTHYQHRTTITSLEQKLYPPGGPSAADLSKGTGDTSGFVDYGPEDDLADREMTTVVSLR
jgi:hypothetical protein